MIEPAKRVAPYLPFKTFLSSLDVLSHGVPPKLDRTLWRSQSGVTQGLIMNAYRFFGLVEDELADSIDGPTEYLDQMAKHPDKRPEVLRFLIEAQYEPILARHDLTKMTLKMLEGAFEQEFSVSGGTKQKAITFFLKAAKFADMPLSPYLSSLLRAAARARAARERSGAGSSPLHSQSCARRKHSPCSSYKRGHINCFDHCESLQDVSGGSAVRFFYRRSTSEIRS
jgi:hypothetical protein